MSENQELAIDVKNLNKYFGDNHAVIDLSIQVKKGEIFGFLGPNGSGKTTTIRMLCGLLTPDSGTGTCLGFDIKKESDKIKRRVGYMTQSFSYWTDLSIRENLDFVARLYEMSQRDQKVDQILKEFGLAKDPGKLAGMLSGGWKQRLALAASILHEPALLLLDEPTAGVDPKARRDFWEELHRLAAQGISILVSTHYMDEAERCHKLAYIAYGNLLVQGTPQEIIAEQKLITWEITGKDLALLSENLKGKAGVEQTILLGNTLRVIGQKEALLHQTLQEVTQDGNFKLKKSEANLEDVFVYLMEKDCGNDLVEE